MAEMAIAPLQLPELLAGLLCALNQRSTSRTIIVLQVVAAAAVVDLAHHLTVTVAVAG